MKVYQKKLSLLQIVSMSLIAIVTIPLVACGSNDSNGTNTSQISVLEEDMNATLIDLRVADVSVMGFTPLTNDYSLVLSSGVTATPLVVATKYSSAATVVITAAANVTSQTKAERTTLIRVTSSNGMATRLYTVEFKNSINEVNLRTAADFVILAKTGISTATTSAITGDIGVSPASASYITGFSLILDASNAYATSSQLTGKVYASDYVVPTPTKISTATEDMLLAYNDADGRTPDFTELFSGDLSGKTFTTGVYKWATSALINTSITITGSATDIFIFQIAGKLTMAANKSVILAGGVLAKNIYWQVADTVSIGTGAHFEGTVLAMTNISCGTNASVNGRLYAQTAVTLDANIVVKH